jgi:hypothetical protein
MVYKILRRSKDGKDSSWAAKDCEITHFQTSIYETAIEQADLMASYIKDCYFDVVKIDTIYTTQTLDELYEKYEEENC